jgi:SAM-dependent methyltransferase
MQRWDAQLYGQSGGFVQDLAADLMEWLSPMPNELDLGCGDGRFTARLQAAGAIVTGVDSSPSMVEAARARNLIVEEAEATALPFGDATFDAVFSNAALHWIRDQDAMLREVRRVLRPGGRFVAEMGGHGNIAAIRVAFAAALERHGVDGNAGDRNYYPTQRAYGERLLRHRFSVERMVHFPRPTPLPETGMLGWLNTFRRGILDDLPTAKRRKVLNDTVEMLLPVLCDEQGQWVADYARLRFAARAI